MLDDAPSDVNLQRLDDRGAVYLGRTLDWLRSAPPVYYSVGIGDPGTRRKVAQMFDKAGYTPATLIDPHAVVGTMARFSPGVVVRAGALISTNVSLGRHVYINLNATVGHDTNCKDYVSVNPGAAVSGECTLEEASLIGAGAVIIQGLEIGSGSVVGAGCVITRNTEPFGVYVGSPGRLIKHAPTQ